MRKSLTKFLILLFLQISAWAYNPPTPPTFMSFVPSSPPGSGCIGTLASYATANGFCSFMSVGLKHVDGVLVRVSAKDVDCGDSTGGAPNFCNWATAEQNSGIYRFALFSGNGFTLTGCSNAANVTTCNFSASSTFNVPQDGAVCITGVSISAYNACWTLTGASYTGANVTSITFAQTSPVSTGTGGNIAMACSKSGSPKLCKLGIVFQHHLGGATKNMPDYPFSQGWANASAGTWQASTRYTFHQSIKTGCGHYYYVTNTIDSAGGGVSGTNTSFPCTGSNVTDNTLTWADAGTNALPQESLVGPGYAGGGNAPTSYAGGGAFYNINSTVGAGVANCTPAACTPDDVGVGFPYFPGTPYLTWINAINATQNDGFGNPGAVWHYAQVVWEPQLLYLRFGGFDNGEWNKFLAGTDQNASAGIADGTTWVTGGMTYSQFRGAYIDAYANSFFKTIVTQWQLSGATYLLDTGTNCFAGGNGAGKCLDYSQDIVTNARQYLNSYGFGNQGWWIQDPVVNAAGSCATAVTGCEWVTFDKYYLGDMVSGAIRHIQLQAPTCPANGNPAHCTNPLEGSLAGFAQLASQHNVTVVEWFAVDCCMAPFDSRYTYTNGVSSGIEYADAQADNYPAYINNLALGLPSSTGAIVGTAAMVGSSRIQ